jgi:hypothetical protein
MLKSAGVVVKASARPPPRPVMRPPTVVGKPPIFVPPTASPTNPGAALSSPNLKIPVKAAPLATNAPIVRTVSSLRNMKPAVSVEQRAKEAEEVTPPKSPNPRPTEPSRTVSALRNQLDGKINLNRGSTIPPEKKP